MIESGHFDPETRVSDTEAAENAVPKPGWVSSLLMALQSKVPAGYEDDDGFHFGAEPSKLH